MLPPRRSSPASEDVRGLSGALWMDHVSPGGELEGISLQLSLFITPPVVEPHESRALCVPPHRAGEETPVVFVGKQTYSLHPIHDHFRADVDDSCDIGQIHPVGPTLGKVGPFDMTCLFAPLDASLPPAETSGGELPRRARRIP